MIITHDAYQYIYRFQGLPKFVQAVSDLVDAYFQEPHEVLVDLDYDSGGGDDEYLLMQVRVENYNNSVMDRIREIRELPEYRNSHLHYEWNFLLTTDFVTIHRRLG